MANTGNDLTVTKLQPMTSEWSLYVGNVYTANSATAALNVEENGYVGVGTRNPQSELSVAGTVTAKKVKVLATGWPDFVFEEGYPLPDLSEVAEFIADKKHLPGIPSASEVEKGGQDIGEMNSKLLQKIEELTLYLIEEQKERKKLEETVKKLQQQIESPAIGLTNDVITIKTKTDMYGEDASSKFDQTMAWIGVFAAIPGYENLVKTIGKTLFGAKVAENAKAVGKALDYTETSVGFADDAGYLDGIK